MAKGLWKTITPIKHLHIRDTTNRLMRSMCGLIRGAYILSPFPMRVGAVLLFIIEL